MKLQTIMEKIKKLPWKRMKWGILAGIGVLLLAGGGLFFYFQKAQAEAASAAAKVPYYTSRVSKGDLRLTATGSGTLTTSNAVNLSFSTEGIVSELNVKVGDKVTKGEVLARLSASDRIEATIANDNLSLLEAKQTLEDLHTNAQVNLATAFQTFVTAQKTYEDALYSQERTDYARCSKTVNTQNQVKYQKALDDLNQAGEHDYGSSAWIEAKNVYDIALANLQYCLGYTQDEKTSAEASLNVAKVALDKAQKTYTTLKENNGIDPTELSIAENKVKAAEAQLASDQASLDSITLTAPIDAVVTSISANAGEVVGTSVYITLADLSGSAVNVQIKQTDQELFVVGTKAEVVFDALPNQTFTGVVTVVEPTLVQSGQYDVIEGTILMDQAVTDNGKFVPYGLAGTVTLVGDEAKNALLIPIDALRSLGDGQYGVFVVDQDSKLRLKTVTVGLQTSTMAEITSGLSENQIVSTGAIKSSN
ncbi:MAG: efflux RND transporter periplasmic adaptor subunit [Anaerolineae bacterium]|nr:efflux RND transporter periplasmic adaptor subunit [Anaerolineae bacterium]